MKRIFVIVPALVVLLGISDVAFAKHHKSSLKKEDNADNERKVPCLVNGVQQMVKSEGVCNDFNGTVATGKTPQGVTAAPKGKITEQKITEQKITEQKIQGK